MSAFRVAGKGRVNSQKSVSFTFDGKRFAGVEGACRQR